MADDKSALEKQLSNPVIVQSNNITSYDNPMIIFGESSHLILAETYRVPEKSKAVKPQTDDVYISVKEKNKILKDVFDKSESLRDFFWREIGPYLIGFQSARSIIDEEVQIIFEGKADIDLSKFSSMLSEGLTASVLNYFKDEFNLSDNQCEQILQGKIDEQVARKRANAAFSAGLQSGQNRTKN
jgi:hypothetical protein